eukprot:164454_1
MSEQKRRLKRADIEKACNPSEYGNKSKYPYINYAFPGIISSDRAEEYDEYMFNNKCNAPPKPRTIYQLRQGMLQSGFEAKNNINEPNQTNVSKHTINIHSNLIKNLRNITYYKLSYNKANIKNGVVILVHGGGYCTKSPLRNLSFAELISKLTGYVCLVLNYKLSPEYRASYSISEVAEFYRYIATNPEYKNIPIAMEGDSCGGGMILSALQIIKQKYKSLSMPCCIWLNSPWAQLNIGVPQSHNRNKFIDGVVKDEILRTYSDWAIGNIDGDLNTLNDNNAIDLRYKYSAVNGDFNGLCPMYFMVGATEMLLDDTLECAKKAYDEGNDVIVDIEPYMLHVYAIRINFFPEAVEATKKGCKWLIKYMKTRPYSKL